MVFVLLHKIDLVSEKMLDKVMAEKSKSVRNALTVKKLKIKEIFGTSIYNETLYLAWSEMIQFLIPFQEKMKKMLKTLCDSSLYQEAALL